jgi:acetyl/propionyl-CoA carboxylase alpha subunit
LASVTKVLVANRGEIALRVMRTCREMGIPTVAVYAEPDARAPHTFFADERVALSGVTPRQGYLDIEQLVGVAKERGADAVHPGYGFLSENPAFAEACARSALTFIGPTARSMRAMGDKVEARRRMVDAGVPVVPGTAALADVAAAVREAERIGYPVMVKAAAGGGGIGMRVAMAAAELPAAFEACRRAAQSSFGSPDVYLERYLQHPRHIEMQILADDHGTTLALGERDCSIQRRHQKLLEETPAVGLSDTQRRAMAQSAVKAAAAVTYRNAGTIEFIVSGEDFYFLEMNTRLQVAPDHGVGPRHRPRPRADPHRPR